MDQTDKIVKDFEPLIKASIKKFYANNNSFEDAYQDGVLKVLELIKTFNGTGKIDLPCYLKFQLKYYYMNRYKLQKREDNKRANNVVIIEDTEEDIFENIADDTDISLEFERKEEYEFLYKAINILSEKQQKVIEYRYFKNLKNKDVAERMKISEETVKDYLKIAKKKMKEYMKQNY